MSMSNPSLPTFRSAQLVLGALIFGLVSLTGTFVVLRANGFGGTSIPAAREALVAALGVLFLSSGVTYAFLRPRFLSRVQASKDEALASIQQGRLPMPLQSAAIVGAALAEGPGLFGAVVYFLGGPAYVLAAPALAILAIAILIPNRERTEELVRSLSPE